MAAISLSTENSTVEARGLGWPLTALGLLGVSWWVWTWSKVDGLVSTHVADHGPLPASVTERAALYSRGTPAERQLSADLEAMSGLYPWGRLPLVLGVCLLAAGWMIAGPRTPRRIMVGVGISLVALILPMLFLATRRESL